MKSSYKSKTTDANGKPIGVGVDMAYDGQPA
jgi:hypothetical protein